MAARKRLAAVAVAVATVMLAGCTYSAEEPGLFPSRVPSQDAETPAAPLPPQPTNPELPVAGEAVWTTGDGLGVTVRFAVHAVRRIPGATILDWSVTPISCPGGRVRRHAAGPRRSRAHPSVRRGRRRDAARFAEPHRVRAAEPPLAPDLQPLPVLADLARSATAADRRDPAASGGLSRSCPPPPPSSMSALANVTPFVHVPVTPVGMAPTRDRAHRPGPSRRAEDPGCKGARGPHRLATASGR